MGRMKKKIFYLWERLGLKRIEVITQEDTARQPKIPQGPKVVRTYE